MSLFVINRYQEEEDDEKPETEENHLLALKKRIEERKRLRKIQSKDAEEKKNDESRKDEKDTDINHQPDITENQVPKSTKKKKKKQKIEKEDEKISIAGANDLLKAKKKRTKLKNNLVEETNGESRKEEKEVDVALQPDVIENQVTKASMKKKKKQKNEKEDENISIEGLGADDLLKAREKLTKLAQYLNETDDDLEEERQDFTVLKAGKQTKGQTVKRVLPDWLSNPEVVSSILNSGPSFEKVQEKGQLDSKLIEILKTQGFTKLFPVQARLLTWLLQCNEDRKKGLWARDTCVSAPTGSGKTLTYVLPIVEILRSRFIRKIRCLIVLPVQELAAQVYKVIQKYASHSTFEHTRLKVGLVSGAASFEKEQTDLVSKDSRGNFTSRVDILVATPRRLTDHIHKTPGFSLNDLQFVVIDEADRETVDWLQELPSPHSKAPLLTLNNMLNNPIPAQKLLFSATLSQDPEKLSRLGLFHPILFTTAIIKGRDDDVNLDKEFASGQKEEGDVGRYTSPNELTIRAIECAEEFKPLAVHHLLTNVDIQQDKTLIFTNSCNATHRLTLLVKSLVSDKDLEVSELSGQMSAKRREQEYQKFFRGETRILICSDVLARGVDIPGIKLVISYDPPKHMRAFIHRAGRTGRAGVPGTAVFLLIPRQIPVFKKLLTEAKKSVPDIEAEDFTSLATNLDYDRHVENLKESLEKERVKSLQKRKFGKKF